MLKACFDYPTLTENVMLMLFPVMLMSVSPIIRLMSVYPLIMLMSVIMLTSVHLSPIMFMSTRLSTLC